MNEQSNPSHSGDEKSADQSAKSEQTLVDVTALALGQTDKQESDRLQQQINQDAELKSWFEDVDSIGHLVRLSSARNLPDRNPALSQLVDEEIDRIGNRQSGVDLAAGSAIQQQNKDSANTGFNDLVASSEDGQVGGIQSGKHNEKTISKSLRNEGSVKTRRWLVWLAGMAACAVVTCIAFFSMNPQQFQQLSGLFQSDRSTSALSDHESAAEPGPSASFPGFDQDAVEEDRLDDRMLAREQSQDEHVDSIRERNQAPMPSVWIEAESPSNEISDLGGEAPVAGHERKRQSLNDGPGSTASTRESATPATLPPAGNATRTRGQGNQRDQTEIAGPAGDGAGAVDELDVNRRGIFETIGGVRILDGMDGGGFGGRGFDGAREGRFANNGFKSADASSGSSPNAQGRSPQFANSESGFSENGKNLSGSGRFFSGHVFYSRGELSESDDDDLRLGGRGLGGRGGERYEALPEQPFVRPLGELARSTFSVDVDTASYSNLRRMIQAGQRPNPAAVRIEDMVNYFSYDYPQPQGDDPFHVNLELATCPWNARHQLLRIGIKAKEIHHEERPISNLVFLIDVSGSMSSQDKLPLLKRGLLGMIDQLNERDHVSIVTYAGSAGIALQPTSGDQKQVIRHAIDQLQAGGSTHGSKGIQLAYELAERHFVTGGANRVLLATDGDLNVGITEDDALIELIQKKAASHVFLTVLGFGTGNLQDAKLKKLASNGNGMYAYIDSDREARRTLVEQMSGSLVTVAKDLKLQLEFNPAEVAGYRLIGYEKRVMANADFHNDQKDAGDIGAGHAVTAFYEIIPAGDGIGTGPIEPKAVALKYQQSTSPLEVAEPETTELTDAAKSGELLTLYLNYKLPESNERERDQEFTLAANPLALESVSSDFRFAAAVASFGLLLRNSRFQGNTSLELIERVAVENLGPDPSGYRAEFVDLVRRLQQQQR